MPIISVNHNKQATVYFGTSASEHSTRDRGGLNTAVKPYLCLNVGNIRVVPSTLVHAWSYTLYRKQPMYPYRRNITFRIKT